MNEITMTLQADHLILEALKEDISSEDVTTNSVMKDYVKGLFLDEKAENAAVDEQIKDIHIKVADKRLPILSLSGGNQQKVVIGKGLLTKPKI